VDAASQLPPEQLTRDFGTADKSVLGTLVHIFAADRVWLARVEGVPSTSFTTEADYDLSVLQNEWPVVHEKWLAWVDGLTDETAAADLHYADMRGNHWQQPPWQIVLHVVNHATQHRGQVAGFLRSMGHAPPPLDLTAFYRTRASRA
jgi:uncharacterized damage-inducible protein DinB